MLAQQIMNGLETGLIYGLLALGFSLVYRTTRVVNFAHGEFFSLAVLTGVAVERAWNFSSLGMALAACTVTVLVAGSLAYFVLWRLKSSLERTVATIAASLALRDGMLLAFGSDSSSLRPFLGEGSWLLSGTSIPKNSIALFAFTGLLLAIFWIVITRTRLGIQMRATAQDRELAAVSGIKIRNVELFAFALGALAAAAAGLLVGSSWQVNYATGTVVGIKAFTAALLGGYGRLGGAILGGLALGVTEALFAGYISSTWKDFAVFLVLLAVLLAFPNGLLSLREKRFSWS